jgi:phosphoribosylformylglycinamidine synthase subunit PurS
MARVVVDVMPKPEILDPQGKAVTGALNRLGFTGVSVRQGKRFELELSAEPDAAALRTIEEAAGTLLANPVIEDYTVRIEP